MSVKRALLWLLLCAVLPLWLFRLLHGSPAFLTMHPVTAMAWFAAAYSTALYLLSVFLRNCSVFDFNWSLLPILYALHFAYHPLTEPLPARRLMILALISAWGLRLTFNWLLKGGMAFEDHRYADFRATMTPLQFQLFAFLVLFLMQAAMVYGMTLPVFTALARPGRPLGLLDGLALAVALAGLTTETIADWQYRRFRLSRAQRRDAGLAYSRFCEQGLWRYSRHPNYFGEILVWWGVYLFAVAATGQWLHATLIGPLTIHGLFVFGSVQLTEKNELRRKPEYADYQRRTPRVIPWPWPRP